MPQYEFIGEANEELDNVRDLAECRSLCLDTTLYECRSATYYTNSRICKLSEETRRSAPSDFRPAERGIYYLENECSDSKRRKTFYDGMQNVIINRPQNNNPRLLLIPFPQFLTTASTWIAPAPTCPSPTPTSAS